MACSPGGRFCRLSLIFTPWAAADRVAVPTLWPWPFCRFTVLGAGALAPLAKAGATARKIMAVSITPNLWIFGGIISGYPPFSFYKTRTLRRQQRLYLDLCREAPGHWSSRNQKKINTHHGDTETRRKPK